MDLHLRRKTRRKAKRGRGWRKEEKGGGREEEKEGRRKGGREGRRKRRREDGREERTILANLAAL